MGAWASRRLGVFMSAVIHLASVFVVAGAALACGVPASAAPLLLIDGDLKIIAASDETNNRRQS